MIGAIAFGKFLFKGKVSRADTIVYRDRINARWWIKKRNCVALGGLDEVPAGSSECIVVGTGFLSHSKVGDHALREPSRFGIEVIVRKSADAADTFNEKMKKTCTVECSI